MRRLKLKLAAAIAALAAIGGTGAPAASAETLYEPVGMTIPQGAPFFPAALATDPVTGDLYVAPTFVFGTLSVRKFHNGVETSFGDNLFQGIAFDPNANRVLTLSNDGKLLTFDSKGAAGISVSLPGVEGQLTIDPDGDFYVNAVDGIREYSPAGVLKQTIDCSACPAPASFSGAKALAMDASGEHLYVADSGNNRVLEFTSSGGDPADFASIPPTVFATGAATAVAVDSNTGDVFIGGDDGAGYHVKGYDSEGAQFTDFGLGKFVNSFAGFFPGWNGDQIAVDPVTSHVYVGDVNFTIPEMKIWEYAPILAPTASPSPASEIGQTTARINASVDPEGDLVTDCRFEYGPTESYGEVVECSDYPGFGTDPVPVSAEISGLQANATYHYRVVATNAAGTEESGDAEFTTLVEQPVVNTGAASGVVSSAATISGSVDPKGNPVTTCRFEYGVSTAYGNQVPCPTDPGSGSGAVPQALALSGLTPNTTYHYRLIAENTGGTSEGADASFRTLPNAPGAITGAASAIAAVSANVAGAVEPQGAPTSYRFEYGTTTAYGQGTAVGSASGAKQAVSAALSALKPGTIYHYRLVAQNAGGTVQGQDQVFTTAARPKGRLSLPGEGSLKGAKAIVPLECRGAELALCEGELVLRARVKQGIRLILVKIGSADFEVSGGDTKAVSVSLNGNGRKVLAQSQGERVSAIASADGRNREVRLSLRSQRKKRGGNAQRGR